MLDIPERLETERLLVRAYRAGDGVLYYAACVRNHAHLLPFEFGNSALDVRSVDDAEALVRSFAADWAARKHFFLGAWDRATGAFVAQVYVGVVDWALPEFELGYWVDCAHEGRGYVTEAARAALELIFGALGAHRVRIGCNETNVRSQRVAERLGFVREAYHRQTRRHIPLPDGTFSGDYVYALLRSDYERLRRRDAGTPEPSPADQADSG